MIHHYPQQAKTSIVHTMAITSILHLSSLAGLILPLSMARAATGHNQLTKVIALNPDDANAYLNRGVTYFKLKQYDKALSDFNKAIALNPYDPPAYYNRGTIYGKFQQYDKALSDFNKVIALQPDFALAYYMRGHTYNFLKQYDKAMHDFQKAYLLAQQQGDTAVVQSAKRNIELLQKQK
jgi:tetratricopeptide (TPR) repeat protein